MFKNLESYFFINQAKITNTDYNPYIVAFVYVNNVFLEVLARKNVLKSY